MWQLLGVCLTGGLGSGCRYLVGLWATSRLGTQLPFGTWIVNTVGCGLFAFLAHAALRRPEITPELRLCLTTGFLGGFTTYSSFNHETIQLWQAGQPLRASGYVLATTLAGIGAALLGHVLARRWLG